MREKLPNMQIFKDKYIYGKVLKTVWIFSINTVLMGESLKFPEKILNLKKSSLKTCSMPTNYH